MNIDMNSVSWFELNLWKRSVTGWKIRKHSNRMRTPICQPCMLRWPPDVSTVRGILKWTNLNRSLLMVTRYHLQGGHDQGQRGHHVPCLKGNLVLGRRESEPLKWGPMVKIWNWAKHSREINSNLEYMEINKFIMWLGPLRLCWKKKFITRLFVVLVVFAMERKNHFSFISMYERIRYTAV